MDLFSAAVFPPSVTEHFTLYVSRFRELASRLLFYVSRLRELASLRSILVFTILTILEIACQFCTHQLFDVITSLIQSKVENGLPKAKEPPLKFKVVGPEAKHGSRLAGVDIFCRTPIDLL